ncbi:hypothetical protein HDU76_001987 [Blyttiomyces sp. JEL0837]|nr:hypothetical protein HDU76_001987 [Blyttiomyces sp. JEL0837]
MTSSIQIGFTMLAVTKDNFVNQILGVGYDDLLLFHRVSGVLVVVLVFLHTIFYTIGVFGSGFAQINITNFNEKIFLIGVSRSDYHNYMGILGLVATVLILWVTGNSVSKD